MQSIAYNLNENLLTNNIKADDVDIQINCIGFSVMDTAFTSNNIIGRNDFYLQYIVKGNLYIQEGSNVINAIPGNIIIYYPNTPYKYYINQKQELRYYWIHFTGNKASKIIEKFSFDNKKLINIGLNNDILEKINIMIKEFVIRDKYFLDSINIKLYNLLLEIARLKENSEDKNQFQNKIYEAVLYINKNYNKYLSIETLANITHFSQSYFRKIFKLYTNQSPMEYILRLRINHSTRLLKTTDLPINHIAKLVGYSDSLYFSRIFKQTLGISPKEYRNSK